MCPHINAHNWLEDINHYHKLWKVKLCCLQTNWLMTVNPLEVRRVSKIDPCGTPADMHNQSGGLTFDCDT